jgi:HK97 family phage major capsid protein
MTYEQKKARFTALMSEQRSFMDKVPGLIASNPNYDFKTDREYTERAHEIDRLSRELQDRPASLAGREDNYGGATPEEQLRYGYDYRRPASGSPSFDRRSSWEQDQLRALATLFRGGPNVIESDHRGVLQRASLSTGSGSVGGYLVPTFVQATVIQDLAKFQTVRRLGASVMPLQGNENVPIISDPEAAFITEANAVSTGMSQTDHLWEIRDSARACVGHD